MAENKKSKSKSSGHLIAPTVVAIGGIDPSAGAGLFMDQLAIRHTGCDFAGICATLTLQNGIEFLQSNPQPAPDVENALRLLQQTKSIAAIKTGALGTAEIIEVICRFVSAHPHIRLIVDPVLKSTTGGALMRGDSEDAYVRRLLSFATLITPNRLEAERLSGMAIRNIPEMETAARRLIDQGARGVLIKGGHLDSIDAIDILALPDQPVVHLVSERLAIGEVRGTGCALASLIAGRIALGDSMVYGVKKARNTLLGAMKSAHFPATGPGILHF